MDRLLGAHLAAENFNRAVGDHFIGIHVGLRAGPGLPDDKREMLVQLAFNDFLGCGDNRFSQFRLKALQRHISARGGLFDNAERPDNGVRLLFPANLEIAQGTLRLCAPVTVAGNVDRPKRISFRALLLHSAVPFSSGIGEKSVLFAKGIQRDNVGTLGVFIV